MQQIVGRADRRVKDLVDYTKLNRHASVDDLENAVTKLRIVEDEVFMGNSDKKQKHRKLKSATSMFMTPTNKIDEPKDRKKKARSFSEKDA